MTTLFDDLPSDLLKEILKYAKQDDLLTLIHTFDDPKIDMQFQATLNKLKKIDNTVSTLPPKGKENTAWRLKRIQENIGRISNNLYDEFYRFLDNHGTRYIDEDLLNEIKMLNNQMEHDGQPMDFSKLYKINDFLERANSYIIKKAIEQQGLDCTEIYIDKHGLTRIPTELFKDKMYSDFWSNLRLLSIAENQLTSLPNLASCKNLTNLYCEHNQLKSLPDLSKCPLETLNCDNNLITSLPGWIEKLNPPINLSISNNPILKNLEPLNKEKTPATKEQPKKHKKSLFYRIKISKNNEDDSKDKKTEVKGKSKKTQQRK